MDKQLAYLYGVFLALIEEQMDATRKLEQGKSGLFGMRASRAEARADKITQFANKILVRKVELGGSDPFGQIRHDLDRIRSEWSNISLRQIDIAKNRFEGMK